MPTKNDDKKKWLRRYQEAKRTAKIYKRQYEEAKEDCYSVSSPVIDGQPKGSGVSDPTRKLDRQTDLYLQYRLYQLEAENVCREIEFAIQNIDDENQRSVLRYKYIDGKHWEDVADAMGYSLKHTHRLHGYALENLVIPATA